MARSVEEQVDEIVENIFDSEKNFESIPALDKLYAELEPKGVVALATLLKSFGALVAKRMQSSDMELQDQANADYPDNKEKIVTVFDDLLRHLRKPEDTLTALFATRSQAERITADIEDAWKKALTPRLKYFRFDHNSEQSQSRRG